jgi:hypothetical protein
MYIIEKDNEIINKYFIESGGEFQYLHEVLEADYTNFNYEKFAELVINECLEVVKNYTLQSSGVNKNYSGKVIPCEKIKKHFNI